MQFAVEIDGRRRDVDVHRIGAQYAVAVDGREYSVDAVRVDRHTLSLLVQEVRKKAADPVTTASREVTLAADAASNELVVQVGTARLAVGLNGRRRGRAPHNHSAEGGPQRVVAPMPGKIVRVLVSKGDTVKPRQPLVVIEAMKMENELRASGDGAVAELYVREGQSVDAGALLAVVVPA
jgi:biotin carboxyl carrier protein